MSIFHDGTLCNVHVRYWSGAKMLTAQDLGLSENEVSEAFKLGKKDLIPESVMQAFRKIEGRARYTVEKNSFPFCIGHAFFLPFKRAEKVFPLLEECKEEYYKLIDDLIENYPEYKEQMRPVYREAAEKAFLNQAPTGVQEFSMEDREAQKEKFIEEFMARIESHYPPAESLRSRFDLQWDVYTISLNAEKTTDSRLLHQVESEERRQLDNLTDQAKRKLDIEDYKAQTHERIGNYVDEVVQVLRKQTSDLCRKVTANIESGQVVTEKTFNVIRNFIEKFEDMNFVGDQMVEEQLQTLKREYLDVFKAKQVEEDVDLKEDLTRRLRVISQAATEVSDVSEITGQYTRKVMWRNGNVPAQDEPEAATA